MFSREIKEKFFLQVLLSFQEFHLRNKPFQGKWANDTYMEN